MITSSGYYTNMMESLILLISFPFFAFVFYEFYIQVSIKKQQVEDKLAAINESCFVATFNYSGNLVSSNNKFNEFLFIDETKSLQHSDLIFINDFDRDEYYKFWKDLLSGKQIQGVFRFKGTQGCEKWSRCSYTPVRTKGGAVYKILLVGSDISEDRKNKLDLERKNIYLEHAAKIIRHDMHSGINTYIPRGVKSIRRRLSQEKIKQFKLDAPLRLLEDGLEHSQLVYRGVYEFTNLVKHNTVMSKKLLNLRDILVGYLSKTSYSDQVAIDFLPEIEVNESLFCTAIDNLIRNGIKYNDSPFKMIAITMIDEETLAVIDNGRGLSQKEFERLCNPYARKKDQKERGSGLGLNITKAILNEHGFQIWAEPQEVGTMIKIRIK